MKKNQTKNKLFFSIIFLCLAVFSFVFVYFKINESHNFNKEYLVVLEKEYYSKQELKALNNSIDLLKERKNFLEKYFAFSSNIVPFLDFLEGSAKKTGNRIEISLVDIPEKENNLIVEMKAEGSFESIYRFLKVLEHAPYQIDFLSFSFSNVSLNEETLEAKEFKNKWEILIKLKLMTFVK